MLSTGQAEKERPPSHCSCLRIPNKVDASLFFEFSCSSLSGAAEPLAPRSVATETTVTGQNSPLASGMGF